jgi:putative flippase GtrA
LRRYGAEAGVMRAGITEFWRLARFFTIGALATLIHTSVAMIAVAAAGTSPTVGTMIGFAAAFLVSYVGHFRFTFAVSGRYRDYLLKFVVSSLASFLLSTGAVWTSTAILGIDYKLALIALAIVVPVGNYLVNRFWVFLQPGSGVSRPLECVVQE